MRPRLRSVGVVGSLLGLAVALGSVVVVRAPGADAAGPRPNIVFVLADDLDRSEMAFMPEVQALVADKGVTFDRYFVSNSLCCPSRVTTLRGQYAHNTGVLSNSGVDGGFPRAHERGIEHETVATRLHDVGYRTGLFGKYLNGYPHTVGRHYVPPGWDEWASPVAGDPYSEYDYTLNHNGILRGYARAPEDYGTNVYVRLAQRFIRRSVKGGRPFFVYLAVFAPHEPATPAPADLGRFSGARAPRTPAYDQADVSSMPSPIRDLPRFTPDEQAAIDRLFERRIESLQAVDRGVADLLATLRVMGVLDDTYVVFTSDNGFHLGQHRLPAGKGMPYDTDVNVPLVVRGPGVPAGQHVAAMATNVDLAPTFATIGGAPPWRSWDGRSLLPLLRHPHRVPPRWRRTVLLEHWVERVAPHAPRPPGGVPEPGDLDQDDARLHPTSILPSRPGRSPLSDRTILGVLGRIPDYVGVRTDRYLYVEYVNGDRELYDLTTDPDEMRNLAGTDPVLEGRLAERIAALRSCRRGACRAADRADVSRQAATDALAVGPGGCEGHDGTRRTCSRWLATNSARSAARSSSVIRR